MPLQAIKISDFSTPLMREITMENELKKRIQALYQADTRYHNFDTGEQAIQAFEQEFLQGNSLYIGMFNDKPICAVGCFTNREAETDMNMEMHTLDFLAMHQQNLNRGIEEQFLKLISQDKYNQNKDGIGVRFTSNSSETLKTIKKLQNLINK